MMVNENEDKSVTKKGSTLKRMRIKTKMEENTLLKTVIRKNMVEENQYSYLRQ